MRKKSIPELDKLFEEIGTYRKSKEFDDLIQFIKKFPHIAPYNAMLIHVQKPGSEYVASAAEWRRSFGRSITPGARPLVTLRPFGPVAFVFDLSDTYGKVPFPEKLLNPFKVEGKISQSFFDQFTANLISDGILYTEADHGTSSAGFIQTGNSNREMKIYTSTKELWVSILYDLVVNRNHPTETKFATVLHELGHMYCGHLGSPNLKWWDDRRNLDIFQREFEAESVCWLVCERMGINNPSAEYLSGYLNNNIEIPNISIDAVLKSVAIVESMMNGIKYPRKEIITHTIELNK